MRCVQRDSLCSKDPRMNVGKIAATSILISGVGLGLAPLMADAVRTAHRPNPASVEVITAAVRAGFAPGDCAVVRPSWFNWPLSRLRGLGPGTDTWPFPALMGAEDLEPISLGNCTRIWWMSFFGRDPGPAPLVDGDIQTGAVVSVPQITDGSHAELRLYTLEKAARLRTLSHEIAEARVFRGVRGSEGVSCRWRAGKHRCQSDGWLDVGLESRHVAHHEVHWVFAHPGRGEDELRIEWAGTNSSAPPGAATTLIVRAGFSMEAVRRHDGSDVRLEVVIDGVLKDTIVLAPHEWVLQRRAWELPFSAAWPTITFKVTADQPGWRELMLEADFVERLSESTRVWVDAGPVSKAP